MHRSIFFSLIFTLVSNLYTEIPDSKRASDARAIVWPGLKKELSEQGFDYHYRMYLRIIKQSDLLEVWFKRDVSTSYLSAITFAFFRAD